MCVWRATNSWLIMTKQSAVYLSRSSRNVLLKGVCSWSLQCHTLQYMKLENTVQEGLHKPSHYDPNLLVYCGSVAAYVCSQVFQLHLWSTTVLCFRIFVKCTLYCPAFFPVYMMTWGLLLVILAVFISLKSFFAFSFLTSNKSISGLFKSKKCLLRYLTFTLISHCYVL